MSGFFLSLRFYQFFWGIFIVIEFFQVWGIPIFWENFLGNFIRFSKFFWNLYFFYYSSRTTLKKPKKQFFLGSDLWIIRNSKAVFSKLFESRHIRKFLTY